MMVAGVGTVIDSIVSRCAYREGEAGVKAGDCADLPSAYDRIDEAVHVCTDEATPTKGQIVVSGEGKDIRRVKEGRSVVSRTVVCVLPVGTLRRTSSSIVAEVICEALAPCVVGEELEAAIEATTTRYLQCVVVHHRLRLGEADLRNLRDLRVWRTRRERREMCKGSDWEGAGLAMPFVGLARIHEVGAGLAQGSADQ